MKRLTRLMLGCKAFDAAPAPLVGLELMAMSKTRQLMVEEGNEGRTVAEPFSALAASSSPQPGATAPSRPPEQNLRQNPSWGATASLAKKR